MSNIIKYGRVYRNSEKKVIDSNNKGVFRQISFRDSERIPGSGEALEDAGEAGEEEIDPEQFLMEERDRFLEEAEKILADAKIQADFLMRQAEERSREMESQAMEGGRQYGYQEGMKRAKEELRIEKEKLERERREMQDYYQQRLLEMEPFMAELVIGMVHSVTDVLLEDRKGIVSHLVRRALGQIKRNNAFIIKVGHDDFPTLVTAKEQLLSCVGEGKSLEVEEDGELEKGHCLIETDDKIIDCSMQTQLEGLFENLRLLSRAQA